VTIRLRHLLLGLLGAGVLGLVVAGAGLINVGASSGHWSITNVFLHWVMRSSVRTAALFVEAPEVVDDPVLVRRATVHFEESCAFCHGSPEQPYPPLPRHMTPPAPTLQNAALQWSPEELFWIVQHGIKFSGMPAWISQERDDEVWAMVAFLRRLPDLDRDGYRQLLGGAETPDAEAAPRLAAVLPGCVSCHGADGGSEAGAFPVIGGQSEAYLAESLKAFLDGRRESGIMEFAVSGLQEEELAELARYYAGRTPATATGPAAGDAERGGRIAAEGVPGARVPACESCHGGGGINPVIPRLDGQDAGYLATQLRLWRDGVRGGTDYSDIMAHVVPGLGDEEIDDVAAFYAGRAGLAPATDEGGPP
jgi:cytochrome c553